MHKTRHQAVVKSPLPTLLQKAQTLTHADHAFAVSFFRALSSVFLNSLRQKMFSPSNCAILCVLLGTVLVAACASISRPALERTHYLLEAFRPDMPVRSQPLEAVLAVRTLRVAAGFDAKPLITVREQGRVEADFQHHFFLAPGQMITGLVRQWLGDAKLFAHVTDLGSLMEPDFVLEGFVPVLSRDFSSGTPKAVLAVQFLLLRSDRNATAQIVLQRDYRREVDLQSASAKELVQGWNQALRHILGNFEADLRQALEAVQKTAPAHKES